MVIGKVYEPPPMAPRPAPPPSAASAASAAGGGAGANGNRHNDPAVTVCFTVKIDGQDLGSFMSCEGLSFEIDIEQREEGGNNDFVHQLPGRVKYSNVKFSRPINSDSAKLARWFSTLRPPIKRTQAEIRALTSKGEEVARWSLTGVIPVKWSGPSLSLEGPKVATETFEIAHHGFLARS